MISHNYDMEIPMVYTMPGPGFAMAHRPENSARQRPAWPGLIGSILVVKSNPQTDKKTVKSHGHRRLL